MPVHRGRGAPEPLGDVLHRAFADTCAEFDARLFGTMGGDTALVTDHLPGHLPGLAGTAFSTATIRQVMDMTTALDFDENHDDPDADIWTYSAAGNPLPKPTRHDGPVGYLDELGRVEQAGPHGLAFSYKTVNTDVLAWIVARVTGLRFHEALSAMVWQPMGAERDAYFTVDAAGPPFAGSGMSVGLRDLGRLGLLMLNGGEIGGRRGFPSTVIARRRDGGDRDASAAAGCDAPASGSHRSMFWVYHNTNGTFAARDVHGQTVYIPPAAEMVPVRVVSHPEPKNSRIDPTSLRAFRAVADRLMDRTAG